MSGVYYNEFDHKAALWLRELIKEGVIPDGVIDERSIENVRADELTGFRQCHFFAGTGGWPIALRLAGIPDDFPCWTGSCPCQPFSNAGKKKGMSDERDLWPVFERLIAEVRPELVFGEQVASAIEWGWIDRVHADLETKGYTCGESVLGAHSVGANHIRQRLYWGAARMAQDSASLGRRGRDNADSAGNNGQVQAPGLVHDERISDGDSQRCIGQSVPDERRPEMPETAGSREPCGMAYDDSPGRRELRRRESVSPELSSAECSGLSSLSPWSDFGLVLCRDTDKQGRHRVRRVPAESILLGVAYGLPEEMDRMRYQSILEHPERAFPLCTKEAVPGRAMLLKGIGNAIVPELAAEFMIVFLNKLNERN